MNGQIDGMGWMREWVGVCLPFLVCGWNESIEGNMRERFRVSNLIYLGGLN